MATFKEIGQQYAQQVRDAVEADKRGGLEWVFCPILYLVSAVLLLAWVAKDAKNRGIDGGAVWVIVILFTHWIGLLVYLASRPSGHLIVCGRCRNKKLNYVLSCPHCGGA
jgi:hypothetical protein